eukprot:3704380-Pyramimonas_sp.AAC.1
MCGSSRRLVIQVSKLTMLILPSCLTIYSTISVLNFGTRLQSTLRGVVWSRMVGTCSLLAVSATS